jgi:dihydroorotate dehydrogenase electron transfer subunit
MPASPARIDERVRILANDPVAPGFLRMRFAAPAIASRIAPGQFFSFRVPASAGGLLLRRPFAPSRVEPGEITFVYAVVGEGTAAMAALPAGVSTGVLGPLGRGFTMPAPGERALLVGGGCGAPTLGFLAERLAAEGTPATVITGATTAARLLHLPELEAVAERAVAATDDGSAGFHGTAVDAARWWLDETGARGTRLYACGPLPMLRGVAALAAGHALPCEVSLEERMGCGFGACMGCAVAVHAETEEGFVYRRVCADGPVFDAREIVW